MEHIVDAKITKVYKGPDGESEYGTWQVYNLYLDKGDKKKFGYMQSGKKPVPIEGMAVKHIEYEVKTTKKDGKTYTNYDIKKMEVANEEIGEAQARTHELAQKTLDEYIPPKNNKDASFYVSYAKDLQIALIQARPPDFDETTLDELVSNVAWAGTLLMQMVNGTPPKKPKNTPTIEDQGKDDQSPIEKPWTNFAGFRKEVESFAEKLGVDVYDRIIDQYKANDLKKLNKEQGLALWQVLKKTEEAQEVPPDDDIPF